MILTPETIQTLTDAAMLAPAVALSSDKGGDKKTGSSAFSMAIFFGFISLVLLNGNMPVNTQFALVIGIIVYFVVIGKEKKGGAAPGADHH